MQTFLCTVGGVYTGRVGRVCLIAAVCFDRHPGCGKKEQHKLKKLHLLSELEGQKKRRKARAGLVQVGGCQETSPRLTSQDVRQLHDYRYQAASICMLQYCRSLPRARWALILEPEGERRTTASKTYSRHCKLNGSRIPLL